MMRHDVVLLRDEIEGIINAMPPRATIRHDDKPENAAWFGRASAAIHKWSPEKGSLAKEHIDLFLSRGHAYTTSQGLTKLLALLNEAKAALDWEASETTTAEKPDVKKIFIGHGRSNIWYQLKAFLNDRLRLECDEFNSEAVAGISTTARLQTLLDNACFAFLVMTGEDVHADETAHARENVVHEAGLFQGRLGFERAIILLEEGCSQFSNIHGLTHISFPKGNLAPAFEQIRRVLEREKVGSAEDPKSQNGSSQQKPRKKWGCYQFEGEEGLFCTACYDTKGKKIQTTRLNPNFRQCPVCKAMLGTG